MTDLPIVSEEELEDLRYKIFEVLDNKDPRLCGEVLSYCLAVIGLTVGMPRERVLITTMYTIHEAWQRIEDARRITIEESEL